MRPIIGAGAVASRLAVERERAARRSRPSRRRSAAARAGGGRRARSRAAGSPSSSSSAAASASGVAGRDEPRGAVLRPTSAKPPTSLEHHRLAEGERRVEDARTARSRGRAGRRRRRARKSAGISASATKRGDEADTARRAAGQLLQRLESHPRHADDPELGALDRGERLEQRVDPLVGAHQAEEEDHRALGRRRARPAAAARPGRSGQVVERRRAGSPRPWPGSSPTSSRSRARAVLGVDDDGVEARREAALRVELRGGSARAAAT